MTALQFAMRSAGLEILGAPSESGEGFVIDPDGLEGLDDGVISKGISVARPQAHGDFDVPGFLEPRIVALSGWCDADSPEKLAWFGSVLTGFLAEGSQPVTFDHMGRILWGNARRAPGTAPKFKIDGRDGLSARFQVQLKFANPRLFGEARVSSSPSLPSYFATLVNYGNFPAAPTYTITSPSTVSGGYTIFGPGGRTFVVSRALNAGEVHTVDMATGYLRVNGAIVYGGVAVGTTWSVPGGGSVEVGVAAPATITGRIYDTFV